MRVITVTGDPGAGKSTAVSTLTGALGAPVWSAGKVARELGPDDIAKGQWGPEEALTRSLVEWLGWQKEADNEFVILDGWPRRPHQVVELPGRLAAVGATWFSAVIMRITPQAALKRYLAAGIGGACGQCGQPLPDSAERCHVCGYEGERIPIQVWYNKRRGTQEETLNTGIGLIWHLHTEIGVPKEFSLIRQ